MQPNLLPEVSLADATGQTPANNSANTGADHLTLAAICMTIAAMHTGQRVTFDDAKQEVVVG